MIADTFADENQENQDVCWICFGKQNLKRVCKCSMFVHPECLARWQITQIGKSEETHCRFCNTEFPKWDKTIEKGIVPSTRPYINITYGHVVMKFYIDNRTRSEFERHVCQVFGAEKLTFSFAIKNTLFESKIEFTERDSNAEQVFNGVSRLLGSR